MAKENETIAEIIAEKRRRADEIERDCAEKMKRGEMVSDCYARELVADIRKEADRLDAAHKRERGDCAKLRDALKAIGGLCAGLMPTWDGLIGRIKDITEAALAEPPRNCDRFGGDIDKLREACARERGLNPEEDFSDVFPGWLLAPSTEKEGDAK